MRIWRVFTYDDCCVAVFFDWPLETMSLLSGMGDELRSFELDRAGWDSFCSY